MLLICKKQSFKSRIFLLPESTPGPAAQRTPRRGCLQRDRRGRSSSPHDLHDGHRDRRQALQGRGPEQERRQEKLRGRRLARDLQHRLPQGRHGHQRLKPDKTDDGRIQFFLFFTGNSFYSSSRQKSGWTFTKLINDHSYDKGTLTLEESYPFLSLK